jgi:hypothetical protein
MRVSSSLTCLPRFEKTLSRDIAAMRLDNDLLGTGVGLRTGSHSSERTSKLYLVGRALVEATGQILVMPECASIASRLATAGTSNPVGLARGQAFG